LAQTTGHQDFPGDRPSTLILLQDLSARSIGALLAAYEHATFTAAAVLGINPFDQFGVELGKQLALQIEESLQPARVQTQVGLVSAASAGNPTLDLATQASLKRLA
jgi:glucose-6-phosphate isomerase